MTNTPPFDEANLSEEDQAILRAFDSHDAWPQYTQELSPTHRPEQEEITTSLPPLDDNEDDIFAIFVQEAKEDIQTLKECQAQLASTTAETDQSYFLPLQRAAHKLHGTAAEMNYIDMSIVAGYIETIAEQVSEHIIPAANALNAIAVAIPILEVSFQPISEGNREATDISTYIPEFHALCARLSINLFPESSARSEPSLPTQTSANIPTSLPAIPDNSLHVDRARLQCLLLSAAQLGEQQTMLEDAQAQVTHAFQELQQAQKNLLQIGTSLTPLLTANFASDTPRTDGKFSSSSFVARIQRDSTKAALLNQHRKKYAYQSNTQEEIYWDSLEKTQFAQREFLQINFKDALSEVAKCTTRLQTAERHLIAMQQLYVEKASHIRDSVLTIPMIPFSTLVAQLEDIVDNSTLGKQKLVTFEAQGANTEIDQDILASLTPPLIQIFQNCTSASMLERINHDSPYRICLNINTVGKEIFIELDFSIDIDGGLINMLSASIDQFHGMFNINSDHADGICITLQFSSAHNIIQGLLVRVHNTYLLVPMSQIQCVSTLEQENDTENFHLADLLNLPAAPSNYTRPTKIHPILVLRPSDFMFTTSVTVDEVIDHIESTIKPLPYGKKQPGIRGVAIDSQQHVLLVPDLRKLISQYERQLSTDLPQLATPRVQHILVADDSAIIRDTVASMLRRAHYEVTEVKNGKEALRQFAVSIPDIALLDIEMPILDGYDLLKYIRSEPLLAHIKTIMLTSRSTEKHRKLATELGVDAYLNKPIREPELLQTINSLLDQP